MPSLSPLGPRFRNAALALIVMLGAATLPSRSPAQYMYLDANGDGVNTAEDVVNPTGPTSVDVYVVTDQNRDGSAPVCPVDQAFTINSYVVVLRAESGTLSWDSFVNRQSTMTVTLVTPGSSSTEFIRGLGGGTILPPGLYRLATVTVSVLSGTPTLGVVSRATTLSAFSRTSFGSMCSGIDGDNTLKLGSDWFDTDGLTFGTTTPVNHPPILGQLSDMTVLSGEVGSQGVTATDPDAQFITIEKGTGPSYMSVLGGISERGSASATIRLAPLSADVGPSSGSVRASDGEATAERSFAISVLRSPEHATILKPIPDIALLAGTVFRVSLYAVDADGSALEFRKESGPRFVQVSSLSQGPAAATGDIQIAPTLCDVGGWSARVAAVGGADLASDEFQIAVRVPGQPPSQSGEVVSVGRGPVHVALRDLDHDGHMDAVSVNEIDGTISAVLGNGDGTLGRRTDYPVGGHPWYVTSGDWNQDGHVDLAVANTLSSNLSILIGVGDGSFVPALPLATRGRPNAVTPADLNGDGRDDLIVANGGDSYVSVFLGGAGGVFQPRLDFPAAGSIYGVAVEDFNRDGRLDVVSANWISRSISFFPGFGDGTLGARTDISLPVSPFSIEAADFDGDGLLDIAVPGYDTVLPILLGRGDGTFRSVAALNASGSAQYAVARDFDGDGRADLAVAGQDYGAFDFFQNIGDGGFARRSTASGSSFALAAADMDEDGRLDVVTAESHPTHTIRVNLNVGGIGVALEGRAFLQGDNRTVGTATAGSLVARLEPVGNSYANADVALATVQMFSEGTGSVDHITAVEAKAVHLGDADRNGVEELPVQFAAADLQNLFDSVGKRQSVDVRLEGSLANGRRFCAPLRLTVSGERGALATRVTPNPLNPSGVLSFRTSRDGYLRVRMFDLNGRLVRVLADRPLVTAGDQEIRIDGRGAGGETLASGAYFYVVETPEGKTRGRIMILK